MPCSLIENVNILNISVYSIFSYKFDGISSLRTISQSYIKIFMDNQRFQNT